MALIRMTVCDVDQLKVAAGTFDHVGEFGGFAAGELGIDENSVSLAHDEIRRYVEAGSICCESLDGQRCSMSGRAECQGCGESQEGRFDGCKHGRCLSKMDCLVSFQ